MAKSTAIVLIMVLSVAAFTSGAPQFDDVIGEIVGGIANGFLCFNGTPTITQTTRNGTVRTCTCQRDLPILFFFGTWRCTAVPGTTTTNSATTTNTPTPTSSG